MPFTGPSSYLVTIDEFIGHWTDVNAALNPAALVLGGPYALADLQSDRDDLATEITELEAAINALEGHRTDRFNQQSAIRERMRQLGAFVRGVVADSVYVGQIPDLVQEGASPGKWIIAMDDYAHMWTTINATPPAGFTPPLTLTGGYLVADFNTDVAALKTTYTDWVQAEQDVDRGRDERDAIYQRVRDQLVRYRLAVPGMFAEDHPLVTSLPRLTPLPGHTPDAVTLSGVWNPGTLMADLSWTASDDEDLDHYSVRRSGSDPYDSSTELVVGTFPPGTLAHSTNAGLDSEGDTMRFKVYVVLTTFNEKGSNAVAVTNA
jgi:hypothetical protein